MEQRYRRGGGVEAAPMEGETLLYHSSTRKFCRLNATAAFLWERLAEPMTVEQLAAELCTAFDGVEIDRARQDAQGAVDELQALSIIERA